MTRISEFLQTSNNRSCTYGEILQFMHRFVNICQFVLSSAKMVQQQVKLHMILEWCRNKRWTCGLSRKNRCCYSWKRAPRILLLVHFSCSFFFFPVSSSVGNSLLPTFLTLFAAWPTDRPTDRWTPTDGPTETEPSDVSLTWGSTWQCQGSSCDFFSPYLAWTCSPM